MKSKFFLYKSAIVASLAGFLFGFITVVFSGAEQTIQLLWELSSTLHGLATNYPFELCGNWGWVVSHL